MSGPRLVAPDATVWHLDLTCPVDLDALSDAERERADRFRFERDRVRFLRRRAGLRRVLAECTDRSAREVRFRVNAYGKPELADGPFFSTSSSGDRALVVVSPSHPVGIDLEEVRPNGDETEVAQRLFADEEIAAIDDAGDFFRCWSRKEAYVKAVGAGLSFPLGSFAVEVADVARPRLLRSDLRPADIDSAGLFDLSDPRGQFAAALVVMGFGRISS